MNSIVTTLSLCGLLSLFGAVAMSANEQTESPNMLSHLSVGKHVRLDRAISGGYNVIVLNQHYIDAFQQQGPDGVSEKIAGIGHDFVRIDAGPGITKLVAGHAIDTITVMSAEYGTAIDGGADRDAEE